MDGKSAKKSRRETFRRGYFALAVIILMFAVLVGRLADLQLVNYEEYRNKALAQYTTEIKIAAKRGTIYDRNGRAMALSMTVETVFISPAKIKDTAQAALIARGLSEILDVDYQSIIEKTTKSKSQYQVIKKNVEEDVANEVRQFILDNGLSQQINLEESSKRYYPFSNLACHCIGFVGADNQGLLGLEAEYNEELSGVDGRVIKALDGNRDELPFKYESYNEAQDGYNLVTTFDHTIQSVLEKYLKKAYDDNLPESRVAGIVMDVNTGEIYASGVYPDFDLNDPYTLTSYFNEDYEVALKDNLSAEDASKLKSSLLYRMWNNKIVSELYEPGSTFKIVTAAMALEEGLYSINDSFNCTGEIVVLGQEINCHKTSGHGLQSFAETLQNSCNPAFVSFGLKVGAEVFMEYFEQFGFTSRTNVDLPGEADTYYYVTSGTQFKDVELAVYSFGQTFKTTAIQQLRAVSTVANGGYLVVPHYAKALTDNEGNVVKTFEYETDRQVVSSEVSDQITKILLGGINTGSTKNAAVAGYSIAAKTGTSQKRDMEDGHYVSSCVAFAPAEDPQVAILVIVDDPTGQDFYGGLVAAPVVSSVLTEVLPYLQIPRNDDGTLDSVTIADYRKMSVNTVKKTLENMKLQCEIVGDGDTVTEQMPRFGSTLTEGGKVILYTGESTGNTATVPDLFGYSPTAATSKLESKGLNILVAGSYSTSIDGTPVAVSQSVEPGTEVPEGTVVEVEFRYYENIDG